MDQDQDDFDAAFADLQKKDSEPVDTPKPDVEAPAPAEPQPEAPASAQGGDAQRVAELERQLADALHRERSSANRISERDRQANAMAQQVRELQARLQEIEAARTAPAPATQDEPDVLDGADDLRSAVERRVQRNMEPLARKLSEAERRAQEAEAAARAAAQAVQPILKEREDRVLQELSTKLDEEFNGWRTEVKSPGFQQWLNAVPEEVRSMYQRADNFDVAARVLRLYSADTGKAFAKSTTPVGNQQPGNLRSAVGIRPSVAGVHARPNPNDFDAAFAEFSTKRSFA